MAKRVMLSYEAYKVLKAMKKEGESFSAVILRKFGRGNPAAILAYLKESEPNPNLTDSVERESEKLRRNLKV